MAHFSFPLVLNTHLLPLIALSLITICGVEAADITNVGLDLIVPPGEVDGIQWPGGKIAALPGLPQTLVVNMKTRELHLLSRAIGDGEIALATMTSSQNEIINLERIAPQAPSTRIPFALRKLAKGDPLKITALGTSLVENGRVPHGWMLQLFDNKQPASRFYVGLDSHLETEPNHIGIKNYALGGSNAHYTAAVVGTAVAGNQSQILSSPAFDCDLAVVGLLPNEGIDRLAIFEGVVRQLRSRSIEVLLLTDNAFSKGGESDPLWKDGEFVRKMADRYGCALADTAAYMREGELRGLSVYKDMIHHAPAGDDCWAEAIAGVLSPGVSLQITEGVETTIPATKQTPISDPLKVADGFQLDFLPKNSGGEFITGASDNRLAKYFRPDMQGFLQLSVGNSLEVNHPDMIAADLIVDGSSGFVAEVQNVSSGHPMKRIAYEPKAGVGSRAVVQTVFSATDLNNVQNAPCSIIVTSGTMWLYGVSYYLKAKP